MVSLINFTSNKSGRSLDDRYARLEPVPHKSLPDITGRDTYTEEEISRFPEGYEVKEITPSLQPGDKQHYLLLFGKWVVSKQVKELIESIEPDTHQFIKLNNIQVPKKHESFYEGMEYYLFHVFQRCEDFIDLEKSDLKKEISNFKDNEFVAFYLRYYADRIGDVYVDSNETNGYHIFKGMHKHFEKGSLATLTGELFVSETMKQAFLDSNLKTIHFFDCLDS